MESEDEESSYLEETFGAKKNAKIASLVNDSRKVNQKQIQQSPPKSSAKLMSKETEKPKRSPVYAQKVAQNVKTITPKQSPKKKSPIVAYNSEEESPASSVDH